VEKLVVGLFFLLGFFGYTILVWRVAQTWARAEQQFKPEVKAMVTLDEHDKEAMRKFGLNPADPLHANAYLRCKGEHHARGGEPELSREGVKARS